MLVTNTVVANTSTSLCESLRETVVNKPVFLVFLWGVNEFHSEGQLPLTTWAAGVHRQLKLVPGPGVLRKSGSRHTGGWSTLMDVSFPIKERKKGRKEAKDEARTPTESSKRHLSSSKRHSSSSNCPGAFPFPLFRLWSSPGRLELGLAKSFVSPIPCLPLGEHTFESNDPSRTQALLPH